MDITSKDNPKIKELAALVSSRDQRGESGRFVIEGQRLCLDAAISGVEIDSLYLTEEALDKLGEDYNTIAKCCLNVYTIREDIAKKISDTKTPQGIFALCSIPSPKTLEEIDPAKGVMLLSSLQDPGNLGTIIRTCEALGLGGVILSEDCPDLYSPKVLRASMGGVFRLPVVSVADIKEAISTLTAQGICVYATALDADSQPVGSLSLGGCGVVIGNEGRGLEQAVIDCCSGKLIIPITPRSESLNAAMAAAIFAWEIARSSPR